MKKIISFFVFMGSFFGVLWVSHWFLYISFVFFFHPPAVADEGVKLVLLLLPLLFVASTLAGHFFDTFLIRIWYCISGLWLGILAHLIAAISVAWIFAGIAYVVHGTFPRVVIGLALCGCAAGASVYGVWNALHPRIRRITVSIPNLPEAWQGKTIVQLSDIHLGLVFRERFLQRVIEVVNTLSPEAVVITGDLFDGMDGDLHMSVRSLDDVRAPRGIFFVTGNHEIYFGIEKVLSYIRQTRVHVLQDATVTIAGLQIVGIGHRMHSAQSLCEAIRASGFSSDHPSVLLYHEPVHIRAIADMGINLQLSGHTHYGQVIPFNLLTRLVFGKYGTGLHTIGGYTLYTTSGVGGWGPTMRTGNRPEIVAITLLRKE